MRDLRLPDRPYPYKVLVSELPALGERPPLRFLIGIDTETFWQAQHSLLVAIVGLAVLGVLLASVLGYWVARIGLRPLLALSNEAQALAPPRLDGRLKTHALPPGWWRLAPRSVAAGTAPAGSRRGCGSSRRPPVAAARHSTAAARRCAAAAGRRWRPTGPASARRQVLSTSGRLRSRMLLPRSEKSMHSAAVRHGNWSA